MRTLRFISMTILPAIVAGGCNAYEQAYSGERWPPVPSSRVVMQQPMPADARLIGQSTFVGTDDQLGDAQAIACGKDMGADIVEWDKSDRGSITQLESVPVYSGWSWSSGFNQVSIPVPVTKETWRVHARFYRSAALGGAPQGQATPQSPPAVKDTPPKRHDGSTQPAPRTPTPPRPSAQGTSGP